MKLPSSQRFLVVYAVVLTAVFVATIFLNAKQSTSRKEAFNEINVQRINIVEPDGTVRMIISDTARAPSAIFKGKEYPHPDGRKVAGMIFYNDEGTENGGLIWGGNKGKDGKVSSHGHLSFDNYEQDQVMVIEGNQDEEGKSSFIRIMDQPDYSLEPLMQLMEKNRDLSKGQLISVHSVAKGRAVFAVYGLGFAAIALEIALLYWRAWQLRVPLRLNNAEQFMTRGAIVGWCIPASVGLVSCILALTLPRDQISCCGWAYFSMFFLLPAYRGLRRRRFARVEATWAH